MFVDIERYEPFLTAKETEGLRLVMQTNFNSECLKELLDSVVLSTALSYTAKEFFCNVAFDPLILTQFEVDYSTMKAAHNFVNLVTWD